MSALRAEEAQGTDEIEDLDSFRQRARAFIRSNLWEPERWPADVLPSIAALCKATQPTAQTLEELEAHYEEQHYQTLLY